MSNQRNECSVFECVNENKSSNYFNLPDGNLVLLKWGENYIFEWFNGQAFGKFLCFRGLFFFIFWFSVRLRLIAWGRLLKWNRKKQKTAEIRKVYYQVVLRCFRNWRMSREIMFSKKKEKTPGSWDHTFWRISQISRPDLDTNKLSIFDIFWQILMNFDKFRRTLTIEWIACLKG